MSPTKAAAPPSAALAFCTLLEWDGTFPFDRYQEMNHRAPWLAKSYNYAKSLKPKPTARRR